MFHKAVNLKYLKDTSMEVTFEDGSVRKYDMSVLFDRYPTLRALEDRKLFLSGKMHSYGIVWNDEIDIDMETIYEDGELLQQHRIVVYSISAQAVASARAAKGISQKRLSELSGIDQSDISKIERGVANPSIATLNRIAQALGGRLSVSIEL